MVNFQNTQPSIDKFFSKMTLIQLFDYMFSDFIEYIFKCSINFANKRYWKEIIFTNDDIYKYLYVYIYLSVYNFYEIEDVWESNNLIKTNIPNIISRKKYRVINKYFYIHLNCYKNS